MTDHSTSLNTISFRREGCYIEAFLFDQDEARYNRIQIEPDRIAYRKEINETQSAIVLVDGTTVCFDLSLDDLGKKIGGHSFKDGPMIDLKPFKPPGFSVDGSLKIRLWVHFMDAAEKHFALATIDDSHIEEYGTFRNGQESYIKLKQAFRDKKKISPCEMGVFVNLKKDILAALVGAAKTERLALVDLTAKTTPVSPEVVRSPITL